MSIQTATEEYEVWLGKQLTLVASDLRRKHERMANPASAFPFFRATFYRWAQKFPKVCPDLADAPRVLAVGDLHVQNFGTWRDADGRLAWGVNDVDEACVMPYTNDLVRLAASAVLQAREEGWGQNIAEACNAVASGYAAGLKARIEGQAKPILIDRHAWLSALLPAHSPARFWKHLRDLASAEHPVPREALDAIHTVLPSGPADWRITPRVAGMGSLGRPRYCALGDWHGGPIAREAKATALSAWTFADSKDVGGAETITKILAGAIRAPDPVFRVVNGWVVRRLAPDCDKIDEIVGEREVRVLRLMGLETANMHVCDAPVLHDLAKDLDARPEGWLKAAVKDMLKSVRADWEAWQESQQQSQASL
jgi:hypothetical protein